MRNLNEYPVTRQEILAFLEEEYCKCNLDLTGNMRPVLLSHIITIVQASFEMHDGFLRRLNQPGMKFVTPFPEATKLIRATPPELDK
jgi:hypothetical protein